MVRMEGLEPAHLSALDPKSSVSTNFTTSAFPIFNRPVGQIGAQRYKRNKNKQICWDFQMGKELPEIRHFEELDYF